MPNTWTWDRCYRPAVHALTRLTRARWKVTVLIPSRDHGPGRDGPGRTKFKSTPVASSAGLRPLDGCQIDGKATAVYDTDSTPCEQKDMFPHEEFPK
jgi:hypothetical protein